MGKLLVAKFHRTLVVVDAQYCFSLCEMSVMPWSTHPRR